MDIRSDTKKSILFPASTNRPSRDFVARELFLQLLCLERKRAERSGKRFLLAMLDCGDVRVRNKEQEISENIQSAIISAIRETDIGGWYEERLVAGIIFTEIAASDKQKTQDAMLARLTCALRNHIDPTHECPINISFHCFPEHRTSTSIGLRVDKKLYPDLFPLVDKNKISRLVKRTLDVIVSLVGLLVLLPLLAIIALAIKLTSKGPILFRQERVGQHGRLFTFLKFRSMRQSSDATIHQQYAQQFISGKIDLIQPKKTSKALYKVTNDPRVTVVGKFLRKSSLDELPQLWTVLRGEMSLVGPRPPIPYEIESYSAWHRNRFLEAKPGVTGLWQVNGRSRTTFNEMVRLDLKYARMWSLWEDIKIILRTPKAILSGEGA